MGRLGGVDCVAHYICACIAAAFSRIPLPVAALAFLRSYRTLLPPLAVCKSAVFIDHLQRFMTLLTL